MKARKKLKMKETTKTMLNNIKNNLEQQLNSISIDFCNDYADIAKNSYLCDLFTEFSDNITSVYTCDRIKFYNEHQSKCEQTLLSMYDAESIAHMIKNDGLNALLSFAGMLGEYESNYNALSGDEDDIKRLLLVNYLIGNDIDIYLSDINLSDFIDNLDTLSIDRISDILDAFNEVNNL